MIIAATRYGKVGSSGGGLPTYSSTGVGPATRVDDETGDWEMAFLGTGTITFGRDVDVDVFLVGGGEEGKTDGNGWGEAWAWGGSGGPGGECITQTGVHLTEGTSYSVAAGVPGASSTAFGYTAQSGYGSAGGAGAKAGSNDLSPFTQANATAGIDGVYAFGTADTLYGPGVKYGAGGGGGAATAGSTQKLYALGGASGGGAGGQDVQGQMDAESGVSNTGGGGGGAYFVATVPGRGAVYHQPGNGGSGIVIIRNARAST